MSGLTGDWKENAKACCLQCVLAAWLSKGARSYRSIRTLSKLPPSVDETLTWCPEGISAHTNLKVTSSLPVTCTMDSVSEAKNSAFDF